MKTLLFLILLNSTVIGCGTAPKATDKKTGGADPANPSITASSANPDEAHKSTQELSFAVDDKTKLPPCEAVRENSLAYVKSEKKLYSCDAGTWTAADLGTAATSDHLVSGLSCGGMLTSSAYNDIFSTFQASYVSKTTASGDVWVEGSIASTSPSEGLRNAISASEFYAAKEAGTNSITIINDVFGGSKAIGSWTLSVSGTTMTAVFTDSDMQKGPTMTWTFACTQTNY